jgi:hypothetical protein
VSRKASPLLTCRDMEILVTLSLRVRLASLGQIARTWWGEGKATMETCHDRLLRLERADFLRRRRVNTICLEPLQGPLASWAPGACSPDLGALAWKLRRRWQSEPRPTLIYMATQRAAALFGGRRRGRAPHAFQISHDLGVTEMFFGLRRIRPEIVDHWIDEDRLAPARRGQKLPDAIVPPGILWATSVALEFGGDYPKSRLQTFHDDNQSRHLPYQIW